MNTYVMIFKNVLEISLFASIMIAVIFLIKAVLGNRIGIKAITFLWLLVALRLCLPVMVESPLHLNSLLPDKPAAQNAQTTDIAAYEPDYDYSGIAPSEYEAEYSDTDIGAAQTQPETRSEAPAQKALFIRIYDKLQSIDLWSAVSVVWLMAAVLVFLVSVEKSIAFSLYAKKHSTPIDDKKFLVGLDILKIECGINRKVVVSSCKFINMPVMYGIIRPHILLPAAMKIKLSKEHLDAILMHELCHIKNWDILKNYAFLIGKAVHWFNPLVWIAQKAAREDTELLCDLNVVNIIGEDKKGLYSQSLVEATRFVIERKTPMLTISLCEDKSNLKERIMHMLRPQKKLKSAGIISTLTAIFMIIGCFTTACQPAPDTTIEYEDPADTQAAASENDTAQTPAEEPVPEEEPDFMQYEAPETFAKTYEKDNLRIMVDAQVEVPEVEKIYTVSFKNRELSQEMADKFLNYFIGDAPVYMRNDSETKASTLENELETWKQAKYNAENNWDEVKDHDPYQDNGGQQGAIDYFQDIIDRLEAQLEDAPQEYGYEPMSRLLAAPVPEGGKDIPPDATEEEIAASKAEDARVAALNASNRELIAYAKMDKSYIDDKMAYIYIHGIPGRPSTLSFDNANEANETGISLSREEMDKLSETINISLDEAVVIAKQMFEDMGFGPMYLSNYNFNALVKDGQTSPCYWLTFYQDIYGLPILPLTNGFKVINRTEPKINEQKMLVYDEPTHELLEAAPSGVASDSIYAVVDEDGVSRLSWDAALEQMDIVEEYTDILSFEQIISIFEDSILELYGNDRNLEIVINTISLSMLPVKAEGSDEIISIPVWDFRGYSYDPNDVEEKERVAKYNVDRTSFFTINALDGSLIDR